MPTQRRCSSRSRRSKESEREREHRERERKIEILKSQWRLPHSGTVQLTFENFWQRVMPGLVDTIMCGCGGNVYAVAVTSKRIIIQNDKRL
jgi:hypothetical protein